MRLSKVTLRGPAALAAFMTALALSACPVDERTLKLEEDSSNAGTGGSSGKRGSSGNGSVNEDGGMGGEGGEAEGGGGSPSEGGDGGTAGSGGRGGSSGGAAGAGGTGGTGGSAGAGGGGTGGSSGSGGGGAGGGGGSSGGGSCAEDLNGNSVADCEETLVVNAAFDVDVSSWALEPSTTKSWDTTNATPKAGSGSISITNDLHDENQTSNIGLGASQCVEASNTTYILRGHAFVAAGSTGVQGQLMAFFYATNNCSGSTLSPAFNGVPFTTSVGSWEYLQTTVTPPEGTHSVLLRLVVVKPFNLPTATAKFDNLLLYQP